MIVMKKAIYVFLILTMIFQDGIAFAFSDRIEGLEYVIRKIDDSPMERTIAQKYDLYQIYFENRSDKTFSIPGYSIDLGVHCSSLAEIRSLSKNKNSNKLAIFTVAASAASFALGGIAKTAASTLRSVSSYKKNRMAMDDDDSILSKNKTYIIYPGDGLSLFLFVDKNLAQSPTTMRFVCHDEDLGINNVVINNHIDLRELNAKNEKNIDETNHNNDENKDSVIAVPSSDAYR